jgi:hypothetical protein
MFEALIARAAAIAARARDKRKKQLEAALRSEAPRGISVRGTDEGIAIEGRGLRPRLAAEPALRDWLERNGR